MAAMDRMGTNNTLMESAVTIISGVRRCDNNSAATLLHTVWLSIAFSNSGSLSHTVIASARLLVHMISKKKKGRQDGDFFLPTYSARRCTLHDTAYKGINFPTHFRRSILNRVPDSHHRCTPRSTSRLSPALPPPF